MNPLLCLLLAEESAPSSVKADEVIAAPTLSLLDGHALELQADSFALWAPATTTARHVARVVLDASF